MRYETPYIRRVSPIVYNACYGGFSLSKNAIEHYNLIGAAKRLHPHDNVDREDPYLIRTIMALGHTAAGGCADLQIHLLSPDTVYRIDSYDGAETIRLFHDHDWRISK